MPSQLTYPGVYIEELSSGVRTITGVATSIAAFVGWSPQGPTDRAVRISSFSHYERLYGPIHAMSYLGYSVRQFFDNGGGEAYVLRIVHDDDKVGECDCGGQKFQASSVGDWSNSYGVSVKKRDDSERFSLSVLRFAIDAQGQPITDEDELKDSPPTTLEVFSNLSHEPDDPRYVKEIVEDELRGSLYIKLATTGTPRDDIKPFTAGAQTAPKSLEDINISPWKECAFLPSQMTTRNSTRSTCSICSASQASPIGRHWAH